MKTVCDIFLIALYPVLPQPKQIVLLTEATDQKTRIWAIFESTDRHKQE